MVSGDHLFTFAVIADTHVTETEASAISNFDIDTVKLGEGRSAYVVAEINRLKPDFVVHLGDITHPGPGTPAYEDSAQRFKAVYEALECPLHLVAGNHDIGEKVFAGELLSRQQAQLTVNDDMIAEYEHHFQAHYHSFEHQDCLFVIINGMIVNSGLACEEEQRQWLETLLDAKPGRRIFMFSHYPPYLSRANENDHYDATDEPGRSWLLGVMERYKVEAFYAGHVHNFFFNHHDETNCYVLPSVSFLRHDYHELFRVAPGMKQGRHDGAKLGYAVVQVHGEGHLNHIIRTHGRTDDQAREAPAAPSTLPLIHGLAPKQRGVGLYLRQPWCDSADIQTPWGLDAFNRKRIRNDYPLLAVWEMGVRDLRVPLDDLADPETQSRMIELAALGHRFTAYSYGLPKGAARQALSDHGHILSAWEVIAPTTSLAGLLDDIAAYKGATPVHFNAYRIDVEAFSSSHGLEVDERGTVEALLALDGARQVIDGMVFGIGWRESPVPAMIAAQDSVAGLGVMATVHVQFAHRKLGDQDENTDKDATERHDANRIAEAVVGVLANANLTVFLDNFTGIDRGYFFSGGLLDRLYNPQAGARIVRHLHAILPEGCDLGDLSENDHGRVLALGRPEGALLLPASDCDPAALPGAPSRDAGRWIDLASGEAPPARLTGPTLVLPN
ncbi:MAG: metallophosphoesterase [Alphaproteobacteria bacterium]